MDNPIHHLVIKLMDIFEVTEPAKGQKWTQQLIESARQPSNVKPAAVSLEEIQNHRGNSRIIDLYNDLRRFHGLQQADGILHLASNLGRDDSLRKFIKIHTLLRESKAKKQQERQQNQQEPQPTPQQQLPPQPPAPAPVQQPQAPRQQTQRELTYRMASTPLHPHKQPVPHMTPIQHQQPIPHQHSEQYYSYKKPHDPPPPHMPKTTPTTAETPVGFRHQHHHNHHQQQHNSYYQHPDLHHHTQQQEQYSMQQPQSQSRDLSVIAITPAHHKKSGDRSQRSEKKMRGKNDILYKKMKAFLADNLFLSFDFKCIDWTQVPPFPPLSSLSDKDQEKALIKDLLYVLVGTEGKYIRMQPSRDSPNKHTIGVERGGHIAVYNSATQIIKICPLYSTVVHYAEDVNFGLVNQALAAPIRELVKEYLTLISNLEIEFRASEGNMTLGSMYNALQTIFNRMNASKQILDQISRSSCWGGHSLSVLHNRVVNYSSDPKTHEFCLKLIEAASEPYFEILEKWLYLGVVEDPYGEFFIDDTENKDSRSNYNFSNNRAITQQNFDIDTYWRKRFTRGDYKHVPDFLKSKQDRIFDTGKYLSVVRQYSKEAFRPLQHEPLRYCVESRIYDECIDEAYRFASKKLLDLLLVENKIIDRLYSLKRYFLFSSGDFFVQFMDMADEELSKTKDDINMTRLESLLELALRTSSCNNDPYKDDVHIKMSDGSLFQIMASINRPNSVDFGEEQVRAEYCHSSGNLLGWESLTLSYEVPWPLSMIICKEYCQTLYQLMFRHLFCCKYIERKLEATWRINRLLKIKNHEGAFALRHKMLHFAHNLLCYIIEIIEPSFQILISKFKDGGIENVNEVIELHRAFLSGLVHDSMLTDNDLLEHVNQLLRSCMDFSVVIEIAMPEDIFQLRIAEINEKFDNQIMILLKAIKMRSQDITASTKLQNIFHRLDFNNFYKTDDLAS